jgi:hypothetical protein
MANELVTNFAAEFLAYQAAKEIADNAQTLEAWNVEDKAFAALLEAIRNEAATALHYRGKATQAKHDSADQNALDTCYEAGIDPDSDAGRLIYFRVYINTLQLF